MTIAEEINDLKSRVSDAFDACADKGATLPAQKTTHTLAETIREIPSGGGCSPTLRRTNANASKKGTDNG